MNANIAPDVQKIDPGCEIYAALDKVLMFPLVGDQPAMDFIDISALFIVNNPAVMEQKLK